MSNGEADARLFSWRGGLYRALAGHKADLCHDLLQKGVIEHLVAKGLLIDTHPTNLTLEPYDLIVLHRSIDFPSYPFEWCGEMLKDATLLICDLQQELAPLGLTLADPHSWNVLFDGSKPVYVDLGSVVPANSVGTKSQLYSFCPFVLYPLLAMSQGQTRIARWLLHDAVVGVREAEFSFLTKERFPELRIPALVAQEGNVWRHIRERAADVTVPLTDTLWSDYSDDVPPLTPCDAWKAKQHNVHRVLCQLLPRTVLDIAANRGWYAQLAATMGSRVVALDTDDAGITRCYADARAKSLSVLPLSMDFTFPAPAYGVGDKRSASATERLQCDLTLTLALVHHLVFKQNRNFEMIVEALTAFSGNWALVEFIPKEDRYVSEWWSERFCWYTLENFIKALGRRFCEFTVLPSYPEPRVMILCKRNEE